MMQGVTAIERVLQAFKLNPEVYNTSLLVGMPF